MDFLWKIQNYIHFNSKQAHNPSSVGPALYKRSELSFTPLRIQHLNSPHLKKQHRRRPRGQRRHRRTAKTAKEAWWGTVCHPALICSTGTSTASEEESSSPWKYSLSAAVSGGRWRLCYDRGRTKHFWQQTQAFSALLPTALHKTHLPRTCPPEPNFVCVFHRLGYSRRESQKWPSQAESREPRLGKPLAPNI